MVVVLEGSLLLEHLSASEPVSDPLARGWTSPNLVSFLHLEDRANVMEPSYVAPERLKGSYPEFLLTPATQYTLFSSPHPSPSPQTTPVQNVCPKNRQRAQVQKQTPQVTNAQQPTLVNPAASTLTKMQSRSPKAKNLSRSSSLQPLSQKNV